MSAMVIFAFETAAPVASVTVPKMLPKTCCALAVPTNEISNTASSATPHLIPQPGRIMRSPWNAVRFLKTLIFFSLEVKQPLSHVVTLY
jgi:hypothetical protein